MSQINIANKADKEIIIGEVISRKGIHGGRYSPSVAKPAANPGIEARSQVKEATFHPRVASTVISNCSKITLIKYNFCPIRMCARVIKMSIT
jgi:hypothetical protein